jgi:hypothetical protein
LEGRHGIRVGEEKRKIIYLSILKQNHLTTYWVQNDLLHIMFLSLSY